MKKGLIFATTLAMALGVGVAVGAHQNEVAEVKAASTVVYLKAGVWNADNAKFYVWNWSNNSDGVKVSMTEVSTDPGVYKATIDSSKTNVIFKRISPGGTGDEWDGDNFWNKTKDLTYTASKPLYEITGWGENDGEWKAYTEPAAASVYKYSLNGGAAVELTKATGTEYASAELDFAKGDVLSFTKDSSAYAVAPKDSGQQTKVYAVEGGLKFAEAYHGKLYLETATAELWAGQFTPGYYLAGVKGEWEPKLAIPAVLEEGENPAYVIEGVALNAGDGIKVINFPTEGNAVTWYNVLYENEQPKVATSTKVAFTVDNNLNLVVTNAGTYNVYYNVTSGWYSIENPSYVPDEPEEDGYYLISSLTDYKYAGATPMTEVDPSTGNVAVLLGYDPEPGEKIKVRSYFSDEDKYSANVDGEKDYGKTDSKLNFEFADTIGEDDTFDIYAFYDGNSFLFSVVPHAERVTVTVVAKQFAGSYYQGETSALYKDTDVIKGQPFTVPDVTPEGYVALGVYSDFNCTVPFESGVTPVESNMLLHIKAMQLGWYLAGGEDETFSVENSMKLGTSTGNKCTGAVEVPEGTTDDEPFVVKPLEYVADAGSGKPGWAPATYDLGHEGEPVFVHIDEETSNFVFTVPGTYAFYVNNENKVWFNGGEYAYIEDFLSHTGTVCHAQGTQTDLDLLQLLWAQFEEGFNGLSEKEIKDIKDVGFNGGNEKAEDAKLRMVARYAYIITKYGTGMFKDFIWEQKVEARQSSLTFSYSDVNNSTMIIVISIAAVSALAFTTLLVFKKRKQK